MKIDFKSTLWTLVKGYCPICRKSFTDWYCPTCGLPKKNSKYARYENTPYLTDCGSYHLRPEFAKYDNFQLCSDCGTTNPYKAKFCRNCGKNITTTARDKNGHGWVDLGLSVLWSTEDSRWSYGWMRPLNEYHVDHMTDEEYAKLPEKDSASDEWGPKWRTPTKDEVQELIDKCKWEKVLIWEPRKWEPYKQLRALKVIGPNGNHIILLPRLENDFFVFWTSTKSTTRERCAQAFRYSESYAKTGDRDALWLSTPFDPTLPFKVPDVRKAALFPVRPVADKKWKGKL